MGVLNISDHLKHRRRITEENQDYTWIGEDVNEVTETEPTQPVRPSPQRKHKSKQHYLKTPGHKPKGSRSGRRYENTCYLLSLVDHEEIGELELSDIVNTTMTIFSSLFDDPQKMKIWNDFANLPEEDQISYLRCQNSYEESTTSECLTEDCRQQTNSELYAAAERSYLNVDKKIRGTFRKKQFSLGSLELLEKDLMECLSNCPDAVIISSQPSSLDRMMVHALCQYLKLLCTSHNFNGTRLMEVESSDAFCLPSISLSNYLKHRILS